MDRCEPYLQALAAIEKAARGNHFARLAFAPGRYLAGISYSKLLYPLTGRSLRCRAPLFFGGSMEVLLPAGLDIYLLGAKAHGSEIRLARFMIRRIAAGMVMLDVGAHFGFFTRLGAALVGKKGKVMAVEAAGSAFEALRRNIEGLPNAEAMRAAAGDEDGTARFYEFPALYSEYNTLEKGQFEGAAWQKGIQPAVVEVPARRMDSLLKAHKMTAQFIKIDVEGAEARVVAGLTGWLQEPHARYLAMEYLSEERHNDNHRRAAAILARHGWAPYAIRADGHLAPCPDIEAYMKERKTDSDNIVFQPQ